MRGILGTRYVPILDLLSVRRNIDRVVFRFQTFPDKTAERWIIFRHQNAHKIALIGFLLMAG